MLLRRNHINEVQIPSLPSRSVTHGALGGTRALLRPRAGVTTLIMMLVKGAMRLGQQRTPLTS
eukprot:3304182-Rhodomonas_salina.3